MSKGFDNLPKELQSLQLLIEQFRDAEDWEERDEVLSDIVRHDTPEALAFLRLIAQNQDEDVYTRCDAICGIALRTQGKERLADMLAYLDDIDSVYEFCRAADTVAEAGLAQAAPKLWAAWEKELDSEARVSTVMALEVIDPETCVQRLVQELAAQDSLEKLQFERDDLILKSLGRIKSQAAKAPLAAWEAKLRALAKQFPDDDAEFEDIADLAAEAIARIDEPESDDTAPPPAAKDDDDDDDL